MPNDQARKAYEEDVRRKPRYHDGAPRKSWDQLGEVARETWRRNPTPRDWPSVPFVDVCEESAYGTTQRLSFQIRVF